MIKASDASSIPAANPADVRAKAPLHDVQSGRDHRELRIDKVGVRGLRFPIQIRDKAHQHQNTIATISMCVDLPRTTGRRKTRQARRGGMPTGPRLP